VRYAYFSGCSAKGSCSELDYSTWAVTRALGIEMEELPDPGCTGAREFRAISRDLHLAANARILALAEHRKLDLMVVCDTCLLNLTETNRDLVADPQLLGRVNALLAEGGMTYTGSIAVKHLLWILLGDYGPQRLRAQVRKPLIGLRVAPYYGCHILRPRSVFGRQAPDTSTSLEELCRILGCDPVPFDGSDQCCGFHVLVTEKHLTLSQGGARLEGAAAAGADCLVTPCPLCHTVLDAFQPEIERSRSRPLRLPILHLSQLVGLALGLTIDELKLSQHVVDAIGPLERVLAGRS